jgi:predicted nucleic acid-binding Zn ribbon protein
MEPDGILDRYEQLKKRKRRQNRQAIILGILFLIIMLVWIGPIFLRR